MDIDRDELWVGDHAGALHLFDMSDGELNLVEVDKLFALVISDNRTITLIHVMVYGLVSKWKYAVRISCRTSQGYMGGPLQV
jgi:hypothetical protein